MFSMFPIWLSKVFAVLYSVKFKMFKPSLGTLISLLTMFIMSHLVHYVVCTKLTTLTNLSMFSLFSLTMSRGIQHPKKKIWYRFFPGEWTLQCNYERIYPTRWHWWIMGFQYSGILGSKRGTHEHHPAIYSCPGPGTSPTCPATKLCSSSLLLTNYPTNDWTQ